MALTKWNDRDVGVCRFYNGSFLLTLMFDNHLYWKRYYGYTLREAMVLFRSYCISEDNKRIGALTLDEVLNNPVSA
jgi:hypothetical protein